MSWINSKISFLLKTYHLKLSNALYARKNHRLLLSKNWCLFNIKLKIKKKNKYLNVLHIKINKYIFFAEEIKSYCAINVYYLTVTIIRRLKKLLRKKLFSIRMTYLKALSQCSNSKLNVRTNCSISKILRQKILIM